MKFKERVGDDNGIQTNVWGPPGWMFLHSIAQNYPWKPTAEKKHSYLNFFKTLAEVLPCGKCRDSYRSYISNKSNSTLFLDNSKLKNRLSCARWLHNVHSKVNRALGKENESFKNVWNRYESYRSKCNKVPKITKIGCVDPMYGFRKKCQIEVIPFTEKDDITSFGSRKKGPSTISLVSIKKSKRPGKKYTATFKVGKNHIRVIHFGAAGMSDYTKHRDTARRSRYIKRHLKDLGTGNPIRAGYLSMFVLWNKKSLAGSIADYRRRLKIYNKTGRFPRKIN